MTTIKSIPAERLSGLDVHEGDTLHILALKEQAFLIEISRTETVEEAAPGKASEWVRNARGSVRRTVAGELPASVGSNSDLVHWLLACPEKGWFEPMERGETTDDLKSGPLE